MEQPGVGVILWRGKGLIAVSLVLSIALAVLVTQEQNKVYASSALLLVAPPDAPAAAGTLARSYAKVIDDRAFLEKIRRQVANGRYTAGQLDHRIDATALGGTSLVRVRAEESTAALAAALAAEVAHAFLGSVPLGSVTLTAPPAPDRDAVRPRPFRNLLAGVMLGLLLGVVLSWLRVRLYGAQYAEAYGTDGPVAAPESLIRP
jgi:capsular polysaccharide biosynthesis protein